MGFCVPGPTVTIDGIVLDAAPMSLNNHLPGVDVETYPLGPGGGTFTDDPDTGVGPGRYVGTGIAVPGGGNATTRKDWPPPTQNSEEQAKAIEISRRPAKPTDPIEAVKLPDGVKYATKISKYLTLADLSANSLFRYHLTSNAGLTIEQIATNLKALSTRLIDPIIDQFGMPGGSISGRAYIVNSGFRAKSGKSAHNRGMAADLMWPGQGKDFHFNVAKFVQANKLDFHHLFVEQGNSWWVHVAYNLQGNIHLTGINPVASDNSNFKYGVSFA